jgi:hypothetical protein
MVRVARKQAESLNLWLFYGLLILTLASPWLLEIGKHSA